MVPALKEPLTVGNMTKLCPKHRLNSVSSSLIRPHRSLPLFLKSKIPVYLLLCHRIKLYISIYKQVEKELFDLAKVVTGDYVQGANDIMFVKNNDFVQLSVPVFQTDHFDAEDTFDKIVINPDTAILIGSLVPEFVITKQANTNKVRVYGTLTVEGGFFGTGVVKKIGG